jgi:hypothetical protein
MVYAELWFIQPGRPTVEKLGGVEDLRQAESLLSELIKTVFLMLAIASFHLLYLLFSCLPSGVKPIAWRNSHPDMPDWELQRQIGRHLFHFFLD